VQATSQSDELHTVCPPGKSAMKTISVWLSRLLSISWNLVLQGERSTSSGISHGFGRNGDQSAFTMSTRGSKILPEPREEMQEPIRTDPTRDGNPAGGVSIMFRLFFQTFAGSAH